MPLNQTDLSIIYTGGSAPRIHMIYDPILFQQYVCDAATGTILTDLAWRIKRLTYTDATYNTLVDVETASAGSFSNPATDLATVQALLYS